MTRAEIIPGSLCLLSGVFVRYLRFGMLKFRRSPGGWKLSPQRIKAAKSAISLLSAWLIFVCVGSY
nr:MAG TPA: hypothetical protein [Caudoviricetes sp.]DAX92293.1 MAG TPA: hypothetical protein [Caudoviricetes sp.]